MFNYKLADRFLSWPIASSAARCPREIAVDPETQAITLKVIN